MVTKTKKALSKMVTKTATPIKFGDQNGDQKYTMVTKRILVTKNQVLVTKTWILVTKPQFW